MKAIKIIIGGAAFLLPDSHQFYEFPTYILQHKDAILQHIEAGKKFSIDPLTNHFEGLSDLKEFKRITGIIGYPFNAHDPDLYAIDRNVEIISEVEL